MADLLQYGSGGGGGASSYNQLTNLPVINGITIKGSKVAADYNLATNTGLDAVREIAEGAQQAVSFTNYETMVTTLNEATEDEYKVGQSIYIETVKVPDVWISQISDTSVPYTYTTDEAIVNALDTAGFLKIGYYRICKLETGKIDMQDYVLKTTKVNGETLDDDVVVTFSNLGGNPSDNAELVTLVNTKQDTITGGASTITSDNLTANRALISNGSGKVAVSSSITATELGYLDGVTSNIQTQLDDKISSTTYPANSFVFVLADNTTETWLIPSTKLS